MQMRNGSENLNILMSNISSELMERTEIESFLYKSVQVLLYYMMCYFIAKFTPWIFVLTLSYVDRKRK